MTKLLADLASSLLEMALKLQLGRASGGAGLGVLGAGGGLKSSVLPGRGLW